jgi:ATP-dependent DNA helicase RecG
VSIEKLPGLGKQTAKYLAHLNIHSIADLLFHLPLRYQDRTTIVPIKNLLPGSEAGIEGVIKNIWRPERGRSKLLCEVDDKTGSIVLRFFHVLRFQIKMLQPGIRIRCYAQINFGQKGLEMIHPEFQVIYPEKNVISENYLTAIYPTTAGLRQHTLRKLNAHALDRIDHVLPDLIPQTVLQTFALPEIKQALHMLHQPPPKTILAELQSYQTSAHRRLIFEELLAYRLSLLHMRKFAEKQPSFLLANKQHVLDAFIKNLPFQLTRAQEKVFNEINIDLQKDQPMLRLVQGDVGSGKTVLAALTMLKAIENGYQAVLMAPTELLAEQHFRVFKKWFEPLGISVALFTSHAKGRNDTLKMIAAGECSIVIGTHALFQKDIHFANLALIIIDEQHRFGVEQRALLREKGIQKEKIPHQLIMTATPIPRTLAMSFYADLDCSTIDELPPGRTPIITSVLANDKRAEIIERLRAILQEGKQAYWVCPLIEESAAVDVRAVTETVVNLQSALPQFKVGLVHGRMKASDKEQVMQDFHSRKIHLLVATTVIEVGVDVPNASLIIIENAERLGLSQLHQLRGRVGRGNHASYCLLLYQAPLSDLAKARLQVMRETTDGFKIAERDLELRGPGEILGTRQTGALTFKIADLMRDHHILSDVQKAAADFMREYPDRVEWLIERWMGKKKFEKL